MQEEAWSMHVCLILIHSDTFSMYICLIYNLTCNSVQAAAGVMTF